MMLSKAAEDVAKINQRTQSKVCQFTCIYIHTHACVHGNIFRMLCCQGQTGNCAAKRTNGKLVTQCCDSICHTAVTILYNTVWRQHVKMFFDFLYLIDFVELAII